MNQRGALLTAERGSTHYLTHYWIGLYTRGCSIQKRPKNFNHKLNDKPLKLCYDVITGKQSQISRKETPP